MVYCLWSVPFREQFRTKYGYSLGLGDVIDKEAEVSKVTIALGTALQRRAQKYARTIRRFWVTDGNRKSRFQFAHCETVFAKIIN